METGIIGPVTVMKSFVAEFGTPSATVHGLVVSAILIPAAVSSFFAGRVADILGRPKAIAVGALIFGIGAALEVRAVKIAVFVFLITVGIVTGSFTCYDSEYLSSSLAWRTPFIVPPPSHSSSLLPPRFGSSRHADAFSTWEHLGVANSEREKADINIEVGVLNTPARSRSVSPERPNIIARTRSRGSAMKSGFLDMFAKDQLSGIGGVLYYAPLLFQQAGLTSTKASFLASGISALLIFTFTIPALLFSDKWGRRTSTIYGGTVLSLLMFLIGILYATSSVHASTGASRWLVILSIYLFTIVYAISWAVGIKVVMAGMHRSVRMIAAVRVSGKEVKQMSKAGHHLPHPPASAQALTVPAALRSTSGKPTRNRPSPPLTPAPIHLKHLILMILALFQQKSLAIPTDAILTPIFLTNDNTTSGTLSQIKRFYVQNGVKIPNPMPDCRRGGEFHQCFFLQRAEESICFAHRSNRAMALNEPQKLEGVADVIQELDAWLENTQFRIAAKGDIGYCIATDRRIKLDPLFGVLGIKAKIDSKELGYSVLRVPGPQSAPVHTKEGTWADLIPIRIISGTPTSSGRQLLTGWKTHITGAVILSPALDLLVITPLT
ncbi:hypothetical protein G7Y89_g13602 [Cudoniella acicularis]|uniref:Major facilitator superfamily (MFS) profile domain-containing protein n=1 Tax=Cudoniella acicularis TaxID=354080 RepID=A0A8H4VY30_9HELO|nr:hypothetical protein G7Y89_g13602 [Cudoniella acicularis]